MSLELLKQRIETRAFWKAGTEDSLLPDRNLTRSGYLTKLARLEGVNVVTSIMGQRRCGKSVVGRQYMAKLWKDGVPRKNILYINFFLKPIAEARKEDNFIALVDWWMSEQVDPAKPSYLVLDEVQELENWDENVASVFEDSSLPCRIIMTGSNSKMLSEELSTRLGGRYTTLQVFPFSFAEYCRFQNLDYSLPHVESYLLEGGMPEVLKTRDEDQRAQLITDIINSTVKHDIVTRYNPSNPRLLYSLIDFCRTAFSQEVSIKSISKAVVQTSSSLVDTYIGYMRDVYFLHSPPTYSYRTKEILKRSVDKIYLGDLAMANYKAQTQRGRLLENMVYLELLRNNFSVQRFLGYRNRNLEIDFYAEKGRTSALIQVCWLLGDSTENQALWEREFGNLYNTHKEASKFVVSLDEDINPPYKETSHLNIMQFLDWVTAAE
jgi:uncharacterized protein